MWPRPPPPRSRPHANDVFGNHGVPIRRASPAPAEQRRYAEKSSSHAACLAPIYPNQLGCIGRDLRSGLDCEQSVRQAFQRGRESALLGIRFAGNDDRKNLCPAPERDELTDLPVHPLALTRARTTDHDEVVGRLQAVADPARRSPPGTSSSSSRKTGLNGRRIGRSSGCSARTAAGNAYDSSCRCSRSANVRSARV